MGTKPSSNCVIYKAEIRWEFHSCLETEIHSGHLFFHTGIFWDLEDKIKPKMIYAY